MNKITDFVWGFFKGLAPYLLTIFMTLVILGALFLWVHRVGFTNFITHADFFDSVKIMPSYELKK